MVDLEAELARLNKEIDGLSAQLERSKNLLSTPSFVERARPEVVERERSKLADLLAREEALRKRIASLQN
jgi:valyl-tRNA synthetase